MTGDDHGGQQTLIGNGGMTQLLTTDTYPRAIPGRSGDEDSGVETMRAESAVTKPEKRRKMRRRGVLPREETQPISKGRRPLRVCVFVHVDNSA